MFGFVDWLALCGLLSASTVGLATAEANHAQSAGQER
jgi:hypothetical protein